MIMGYKPRIYIYILYNICTGIYYFYMNYVPLFKWSVLLLNLLCFLCFFLTPPILEVACQVNIFSTFWPLGFLWTYGAQILMDNHHGFHSNFYGYPAIYRPEHHILVIYSSTVHPRHPHCGCCENFEAPMVSLECFQNTYRGETSR